MMTIHTPDRWVMLEISSPKHGKIRKILGGWYGGYLGSDSWRLSSGNRYIVDKGDYYEIPQESGSTYQCYKQAAGMSSYMSMIFDGWQKQLAENNTGASITIVEEPLIES